MVEQEESTINPNLKVVYIHEDTFLSVYDEIETTIHENIKGDYEFHKDQIVDQIKRILNTKSDLIYKEVKEYESEEDVDFGDRDKEEIIDAAIDILAESVYELVIGRDRSAYSRGMTDKQEKIHRIFRDLSVKYGAELRETQLRYNQGRDFWRTIEGDIVIRDSSKRVGINHTFKKTSGERAKISTDVNSSLTLSAYFISKVKEAIDEHGQRASQQLDNRDLQHIADHLESVVEHSSEGETQSSLDEFDISEGESEGE